MVAVAAVDDVSLTGKKVRVGTFVVVVVVVVAVDNVVTK